MSTEIAGQSPNTVAICCHLAASSRQSPRKCAGCLRRQVVGVRETWLHPHLPVGQEAPVFVPAKQHDSAAESAADGHSVQGAETVIEHGSDPTPDATHISQLEQQMQAAALADE